FVSDSRVDVTTDTPQSAPSAMTPADINGDGRVDLIFSNTSLRVVELFSTGVNNQTPISVSVPVQQDVSDISFVNGQFAQVGGRVFADVDRSGLHDPDKPGRAWVTVYFDIKRNGQSDAGEPVSVTDSYGHFGSSGLP